jgi:Predicted nucleotide-binding protein containing TIR -like domain
MNHLITRNQDLSLEFRQAKTNKKKVDILLEWMYLKSVMSEKHIDGHYSPIDKNGSKIFISYTSEGDDYTIANFLYTDLSNEGHSIWMDQWNITVGQSIPGEVNKALAESDFMLLLLSKAAVNSYWVNAEWQAMFMNEMKKEKVAILPLLLEECEIPALLHSKKYANFKNGYPDGLDEIRLAIRKLQERKKEIEETHKNK